MTELLAERRAHPDTVESLLEFIGDVARSVTGLAGEDDFAEYLPELADAAAGPASSVHLSWRPSLP